MLSMLLKLMLGIVATWLSGIPAFFLAKMGVHGRVVDYSAPTIGCWILADSVHFLVWFFTACYVSFSLVYVSAFVANVSDKTATDWCVVALVSLMKTYIIVPVTLALFYAWAFEKCATHPDVLLSLLKHEKIGAAHGREHRQADPTPILNPPEATTPPMDDQSIASDLTDRDFSGAPKVFGKLGTLPPNVC